MKVVTKKKVINPKRVLNEKEALYDLVSSPFINKILATFNDSESLYFLLELAEGGPLYKHIRSSPGNRLGPYRCKFYAAQVLLGKVYSIF